MYYIIHALNFCSATTAIHESAPFGGREPEKQHAIHKMPLLVDGSRKKAMLSTKHPFWWTVAGKTARRSEEHTSELQSPG